MPRREMKLSVFCAGSGSYHQAGWRHPDANPNYPNDFSLWIDVARKLEAAKFDMMFVADLISPANVKKPDIFPYSSEADGFEPMTWLAALVAHTTHLGLAATIATSYPPPYDVAREVVSLDLISGGRAAWNIVTGISPEDAEQYADQVFPQPEERYARGEEFVDVVPKLWSSVGTNAFPRNKETGEYADPTRIKLANHQGTYYKVRGPSTSTLRHRAGRCLLGPGSRRRGVASPPASARSSSRRSPRSIRPRRSGTTSEAARPRTAENPDHVKIMPGCMIIVGNSRQEADEKWERLNGYIDLRPAMARLQMALKFIDLSQYPNDGPFPELPPEAVISRGMNHVEAARREKLTLREVLIRSSASNAHFTCKGTPQDVADELQSWFEGGACDGFNLLIPIMPASLDEFIADVLPELRRRGLVRTGYSGRTLRDNLEIPVEPIPLGS